MHAREELQKIFLSPPKSIGERIKLFVMLVLTFTLFFQPLQFSKITPAEAFLTALMPAATISWGWIVMLRYRSKK